ncbi:MAG: DUF1801 domain-containing protein [Acidimicrobiia bacterium]
MAENKTKATDASVRAYLDTVTEGQRRVDSDAIIEMMRRVSGHEPAMWGPSIIGFGSYHYRYDSGHEGDSSLTGFSPKGKEISLYVLAGAPEQEDLLGRLGKHRAGKACLYVKRLSDIDLTVLERLIAAGIAEIRRRHP